MYNPAFPEKQTHPHELYVNKQTVGSISFFDYIYNITSIHAVIIIVIYEITIYNSQSLEFSLHQTVSYRYYILSSTIYI